MENEPIYHEKQKLQLCLLHALNNLMQGHDLFSRSELDSIAEKLITDDPSEIRWTPLSFVFKPHHNALTGNYDANVLIAALETRQKRVIWHDRRNGAASIDLDGELLMGIMLNIPTKRFGGLWKGRHWVSLCNINGVWYNLDSDLAFPKSLHLKEEITEFLDDVISQGGEILIILHDKL